MNLKSADSTQNIICPMGIKGDGSISETRSRVTSMRLKTKRKPHVWI